MLNGADVFVYLIGSALSAGAMYTKHILSPYPLKPTRLFIVPTVKSRMMYMFRL